MPKKAPKVIGGIGIAAFALVAVVLLANVVLAWRPVSKALSEDSRNSGYVLRAHLGGYVNPSTLVLDLREVKLAAPVDLLRGVFQSAGALHSAGRRFDRVVLERQGTPVFLMKGQDFADIGAQQTSGENPVYMIRKFPSKLYRPDGTAAYGEWTGGIFGVLKNEMEDVTHAITEWSGGPSSPAGPQ